MLRIIPIFILVAVLTHVCVAQHISDFLSTFKGYKNNTIHLDAKITVQDLTPEPDKFNRTHSLNSYFSLGDPRVVLDFSNISLKMTYPDKSTQIVKLKEKFTFDGQNWRTYSYSKNDGNKTYPINTMVISETPPTFLKHFLTIYSGKSFFCNYFKFFETSKETLTVLSILNTKPVFPPLEIKTKENEIEIFGEIANYVWKCKIIKYKTSPLLRYYYYQHGDGYTVTYNGITYIISKLGDTTGDGIIDSADLLALKKHLLGKDKIKDTDVLKAADATNNGVVDSADLLAVKKYLLKKSNITI